MGITGWVKNLKDGRVELLCEGQAAVLNKYLDKLNDTFGAYIKDASIEPQKAIGEFEGFDIKF